MIKFIILLHFHLMSDSFDEPINIPSQISDFYIIRKWKDSRFSTLYYVGKQNLYFICKAIPKKNYIGNEIEIQKSLTHDNIQDIIYQCEDSENIYIFTFQEKESLQEFLDRNGKLDENQAKHFMHQILNALQYVHKHEISFCDIKPKNFLMTNYYHLFLFNFGCAVIGKIVHEARGTPLYMSPERISKKGSFDGFASDIWSCGVVLYRMLTGELPYKKARTLTQLRDLIHSVKFELDDEFSASASDLLSKMTQKDPTKRPTAEDALHHNWFE